MHSPDVATPLGFDLMTRPFVGGFGMLRATYHNYYVFYTRMGAPPSPAASASVDLGAVIEGGRRWREEVLPEVQGYDRRYRETDFDAMPDAELVAELDGLVRVRTRCGQLHTMATFPWWVGMENLIETYRELTGGRRAEPRGADGARVRVAGGAECAKRDEAHRRRAAGGGGRERRDCPHPEVTNSELDCHEGGAHWVTLRGL